MAVVNVHYQGTEADLRNALAEASQDLRTIEQQAPRHPWSPSLKLTTDDVYPILFEPNWINTVQLGSAPTAGRAATASVSTTGIQEEDVPLPTSKKFVVAGVVGGMGPEATVDLNHKLFIAAQAKGQPTTDQEHMPVITMNVSHTIGDRTAYLNSFQGDRSDPDAWRAHLLAKVPENPFWGVLANARALIAAGAHFLMFPCNTWHAWFEVLQEYLKVPMLHIAEAAVLALNKADLDPSKPVGLMATTGTTQSLLYQNAGTRMESRGCPHITWALPSRKSQEEEMMPAIYDGVKAGNVPLGAQLADKGARNLIRAHQPSAIVLGCTEFPVAFRGKEDDYAPTVLIDATMALAELAVDFSMALRDVYAELYVEPKPVRVYNTPLGPTPSPSERGDNNSPSPSPRHAGFLIPPRSETAWSSPVGSPSGASYLSAPPAGNRQRRLSSLERAERPALIQEEADDEGAIPMVLMPRNREQR